MNLTRVEFYWGSIDLKSGWYICEYHSIDALLKANPSTIDGPYETQAEAARLLRKSTDCETVEAKGSADET